MIRNHFHFDQILVVSNSQLELLASLKLKQVEEQIAKESQLSGITVDLTEELVQSWQDGLRTQAQQASQVAAKQGLADEGDDCGCSHSLHL
jgi:hypothetical protein